MVRFSKGRTWRHMYQYPAYGRGLADAAFPSYGIPGVYRLYWLVERLLFWAWWKLPPEEKALLIG